MTTPGRVIFNEEIDRALAESVDLEGEAGHEYINRTLDKREMGDLIAELVDVYGAPAIAPVLDMIKSLGFTYATRAGISVSKNDVVIPPNKEEILQDYEGRVATVEGQHARGLITDEERHEIIVNLWTEATDEVASAMEKSLDELNPIFMMANSGARGSFTQIRQLAGMRGLMANPKGEIIERPIKANFMEGLSVLEYFISTHGARKGLADTALRTADSGYLTRRLVDVSQDVIIREDDCKTKEFIELPLHVAGEGINKSLLGRIVAVDVHNHQEGRLSRREGAAGEGHRDPQRRDRGARGAVLGPARRAHSGALGAQVPQRVRHLPDLLRHLPRHRRAL